MTLTQAVAAIGAALNLPDDASRDDVVSAVNDVVAAIADIRTRVYPSIIDGVLAAHGVHLT